MQRNVKKHERDTFIFYNEARGQRRPIMQKGKGIHGGRQGQTVMKSAIALIISAILRPKGEPGEDTNLARFPKGFSCEIS